MTSRHGRWYAENIASLTKKKPAAKKRSRPSRDASDSIRCRLCGERFRLITHTHLRGKHRWSADRPSEIYKERFGVPSVWSGRSLRTMSDSLYAHWDRTGRLWTRKDILRSIRKRVRSGKRVHYSAVWRGEKELYWTAQRLFGSWRKALRAAGVPRDAWTMWPKWTRDRIVDAIRKRHRSGRPVQYSSIWKADKSLYWAAQRHWGSWKSALRAAGIPPRAWTIRPKWSREAIADAVRRRYRSGKPVHYSAVRRGDSALYKAALRHVGNWRTALRLAGIPEKDRRLPPGRSKK